MGALARRDAYFNVSRASPFILSPNTARTLTKGDEVMLWTILVILLVLWLLGFGFGIGGGTSLIHILLVVAAIVLVYNLVSGRRTV